MMRNLKALGLALVAVFAMSAMAASAAQAEKAADFSAESYPAHIDAVGEGTHTFSVGGLTLTCVTGATPAVDGTATLEGQSAELTGTNIDYTNCHVVFIVTFPVTVDMNGCDYQFTAGTKTATGSEGSVHIKCPEVEGVKQQITITIFKAGAHEPHTAVDRRCEIHVAEQTPSSGKIIYTNTNTEGKMAVTTTAENIVVSATKTNAGNAICPEEETLNSTYNGSFWAKATSGGSYIDTTVVGT